MFSELEVKMHEATELIIQNTDTYKLDWRDEVIALLIDALEIIAVQLKDLEQAVATPFDS